MKLNQWRNTETVIDWFKGIRNKHLCKFVIFDNQEFHSSITWKALLLLKHTVLSDDEKAIIHQAGKSFLNDQQTWITKNSRLFVVMMGAYNGAEDYELVDNHLLYKLPKSCEKKK